MKLIKRHKGLAIVGGLSLILLVVIFAIFARMLFTSKSSEYGDRLNGLVKIDKNVTDSVIEKIKNDESVSDVKIRTQGKIIYITITFNEKGKLANAKTIANNILKEYPEDVLGYYDLEFLLNQKLEVKEGEDDKSFAAAGTKHSDLDYISWTK